ncbi:hypothetical protein ACTID9_13880 [Brevibacillus fluminis]|uniref:hypothetical protein n=1 Tax=Brevibacillus fluminis TaxID=511487 RepID=UPI003F8CE91C
MRSFKRFGILLGYTVLLFAAMYAYQLFEMHVRQVAQTTFDMLPYIVHSTFAPMILGLLFGLPRMLEMQQKPGKWQIDWLKLLVLGIPFCYCATVFLSAVYIQPFFPFGFETQWLSKICGVAFGYLLLTSFTKKT